MTTIDFGAPTLHSGLIARFAIEHGLFRKAGIDLQVRNVFGGPELAKAYDSGEIRIGEIGSPPAVTAIANGHRMRIVGSSMRRGLALFLVTRPDIQRIQELKGQRLGALSQGSCSDWFLRELLGQHGLDVERDVHIEGLGERHAQVLDLMADGTIAAALVSGLNAVMGEARGVLKNWGTVFELADVPRVQWSVYVANERYAAQQREEMTAILQTLKAAGQLAKSEPQEWIQFTASLMGIDAALARKVYEMELPFLHFDCRLDEAGLDSMVDIQYGLGAIAHRPCQSDLVVPVALQ